MVTYDPSYKTQNIGTYTATPAQVASLYPTGTTSVEQNHYIDARGFLFVTQTNPSNDLFISRFEGPSTSTTHNDILDQMIIRGGGHGLGLHAEDPSGTTYIWASLPDRLARFEYKAGFDGVPSAIPNLTWMPQFLNYYKEYQESQYTFDTAKGYAVERQWDYHTNNRERYTRRLISDIKAGIDSPKGAQIWLNATPPTMQGFATMNDTLFRWVGNNNAATLNNFNTADPMALEQYDWNTGGWIATKQFPTLGQTNSGPTYWKDGQYEPEGATVFRESDGTASLIVGVTVGSAANGHRYPIYKLKSIGAA